MRIAQPARGPPGSRRAAHSGRPLEPLLRVGRRAGDNDPMHALLAGLTTLDVLHALDHEPDTTTKTTSIDHAMTAGGPATNAAVTIAALESLRPTRPGAPASSIDLLTAIGEGTIASVVAADLEECGVSALDATAADSPVREPAISSIVEHPKGRMVASTNARIEVDASLGEALLGAALERNGSPDVVLVDGHNPALASLALSLGLPDAGPDDDPFARLEARPSYARVLDGGSWKPWFAPLLPFVDVAVVSADFRPPLLERAEGEGIADFLRGFGITRTLRTRGPEPVQWWWGGAAGETPVDEVEAASTLGAGDVFHGAFAWALGVLHEVGRPLPASPESLIRFASRIAGVSTTLFGTRSWRADPRIADAVAEFLADDQAGFGASDAAERRQRSTHD